MKRHVCVAAAMVLMPITAALAAPIADQDSCNKRSFEVAEKASKAKLPDADIAKVEEKLAALDSQCAGGAFADAEATAKEIEALLPK